MKKILSIALALMLALACVFALVACDGETTEVEAAIRAAESMSWEELAAAAKAEMEASTSKFTYGSLSSGIDKALVALANTEGFEWLRDVSSFDADKNTYTKANVVKTAQTKDNALYTALSNALRANGYYSDLVMIQDGAQLQNTMIATGYLLPFNPAQIEGELDVADEDRNPLAAVYYNKVFMWRKDLVGEDYLTNIWQLTNLSGGKKPPVSAVSFQDPRNESINMSFLISMLSDESCALLKDAWKDQFNTDWVEKTGFNNIGEYFVSEFLKSSSNGGLMISHSSDTTAIDTTLGNLTAGASEGTVFFAGVCKLKDYRKKSESKPGVDNLTSAKAEVAATGWNGTNIKGFDGFVYKMWNMIPKTAKHPYTACLVMRYMLTQEGFNAGWKDMGYYTANNELTSSEAKYADPDLSVWKQTCLIEDIAFIVSDYAYNVMFVKSVL